ncbi:MAG: murein biosynthesis integral membrane protein MurJ [Spirochaetia bacterium]|nr:murein biosynthesis integral membrane protein MurJ [Spirochaetia bacterium]
METEKSSNSSSRKLKLSTISVMLCTLLSRLLGFVKIVIIGAIFGASGKADVLNAVFAIPNNLRKLMAEGALSSAFIPVLSSSIVKDKDHNVTKKIVNNIMAFQILVLVPLCIISIIYADFLVNKVLLNFSDPGLRILAVDLFRWFISYILLISISAVLMAVLNSYGYFTVPALTPILFSVAVIISILFLHKDLGVYSMAVGVLAGGVMQIFFQYPRYRKLGFDFKLSFDLKNENFRKIITNWLPVVATSSIFAINQQISMRFASELETGSSSAISYALVFWQLPFGIFSATITTVLFPKMSREAAAGSLKELISTFTTGIISLMALLVPSSLIMYFFGYDIISIGMQRGSFTVENTAMAGFVLQAYAFGLFGTGAFNFIQRYYYSIDSYRKPFMFALMCAAMDVGLSLWLKETPLRVAGLAWANTIAFTVGTCIMLADVKRSAPDLSILRMVRELLLILVALAGGMLPIVFFRFKWGDLWRGGATLGYFTLFMLTMAVFSVIVLGLYKVLGVDSIFQLRRRRR